MEQSLSPQWGGERERKSHTLGKTGQSMVNHFLVRLTIGFLVVLGFKLSALYFLPMVLLLNTHHKEFFGW
ncbi:hypothetical protein AL536_22765 [Vibrio fluvialis]|jgi:hypothetical protein|uniref:Uncharacterized protein n=2 Tax=Vibrio fluvialis TaxID=676 RepID=A0ABM6RLW0_VIBFL|nr:hypothetical protein AL536_22765 [Vibrio fluvialis]TNF11667.1 MAG: hypothetical protein EP325_14910 [Vibrionaceae bacterium]AVH31356.1 hypothetical protein AL475_05350 [Vibrio fluvialis]EKO3967046.1 hypothetical protein [Vibrio fluvialis]EKO3970936.1 hypothetical protein [Vibrio fluvialis]